MKEMDRRCQVRSGGERTRERGRDVTVWIYRVPYVYMYA